MSEAEERLVQVMKNSAAEIERLEVRNATLRDLLAVVLGRLEVEAAVATGETGNASPFTQSAVRRARRMLDMEPKP